MIGVAPRGAHVRQTSGAIRKPDSSMKIRDAFRRTAFFYQGPFFLDPAADFVLIALHGPALELLEAPPQGVQETANVADMVEQPESV